MALSPIPDPNADHAFEDLSGSNIGRFAVKARIGQGGMGEVYVAEDTALHRMVALKRVPPHLRFDSDYRRRFLAEAERASQINDPHIAAIYDIIDTGSDLFLVMEYVDGRTLRQRINEGRLSSSEFVEIAVQCAEGLAAAHQRGLVHCDIKPENLIVDHQGKLKILDFGIARRLPHTAAAASQDIPTLEQSLHSFSGTPAYMAPELLLERLPDGRSDIFSLGVVGYECLSGKNPFLADSVIETADCVLHETPPSLTRVNAAVSPQLNAIVCRMLAKKATDRYSSAAQLLSDLRALSTGGAVAPVNARRGLWKWLSIAAIAAVLAVGALLISYRAGFSRKGSPVAQVPRKELAILPFTNPDAQTRPFSDGLTETLAAKLSQLGDRYPVDVVPASEVRSQKVANVEEAQKILGVNMVLEGTLRESAGMVRVTYSLLDAKTHRQLRGDSITATLSNPFAVEDKIVDSILSSLEIVLLPEDRKALMVRGTTEPHAYDYYLQGRGYLQNYHKAEDVQNAITEFRHALDRDPQYALAWAGMGEAYWYRYEADKTPDWAKKAQDACEHAVQLNASAAAAHACLGTVYIGTGHYNQAVQQFQRAVDLEPASEDAHLGLASAYEKLDRLGDAENTFKRAISFHPNYWGGYNRLGVFYFNHGRYADARDMFSRVIALAPDNFRGYSNLGGALLALDEYDKAIPVLERAAAIRPQSDSYSNLGTAYFYQHRFAEAARTYEQAIQIDPGQYMLWGNVAEAYYWMGRRTDANRDYRKAIELARQDLTVNPKNAEVRGDCAMYLAMAGDRSAAQHDLSSALAAAPANDSDTLYKAAIVYTQSGDSDKAIAYIQKAVAAGFSPNRIRDNPVFDGLRTDARFQALNLK
jgi:tetratricopeptide (TPR) repeat protein/tRNA A-37 threonylcarbamoyl transferase component Bud32